MAVAGAEALEVGLVVAALAEAVAVALVAEALAVAEQEGNGKIRNCKLACFKNSTNEKIFYPFSCINFYILLQQ
jgi:hypothetical protein